MMSVQIESANTVPKDLPPKPAPKRAPVGRAKKEYKCRATQTFPRFDLAPAGAPVAVDIEFQNYVKAGSKPQHRVGRITIVNAKGEAVLDVYAAYSREPGVVKSLPPRSLDLGVVWEDLQFANGAVSAVKVERWAKRLFAGRTVVLWGGKHDRTAFYLLEKEDVFKDSRVVDEQVRHSRAGRPLSLRRAAETLLGRDIQRSGHSSLEDARATMEIWLLKHTPEGVPIWKTKLEEKGKSVKQPLEPSDDWTW